MEVRQLDQRQWGATKRFEAEEAILKFRKIVLRGWWRMGWGDLNLETI